MTKFNLNGNSNIGQALWVGLGSLSSFALAIVSAAILSRYFDKIEYGTYRQILYVYNSLLIIFTAGLPTVFSYFLPRYSIEEGKDIVWKISKMLFYFGVMFSVFLFLSSGLIANILNNPELAIGLKYFSPIPMLLLPTLGIEGIFSTYKKTIFIAIYNTLSRLLMLLFIVLPVILLKGSYLYAIYGWIAVSIITLISAFYFKNIPFRGVTKKRTSLKINEVFKYSLPLVGASIAGVAIKSADQFYISRYFGTEVFAEYANGFIQIPFVGMVTGATSLILMPQFSKMIYDKTEINKIATVWKSALTKSAIIIYPMVIFFIFNAKPIVVLLYSENYLNSVVYFQIAMIVNFFNIIVFAPLLFSLGETKYYSKIQMLGAIAAWGGGFIIVNTVFKPEFIAFLSVGITILLVIANMFKVSNILKLSLLKLIPVKSFLNVGIHSVLIISLVLLGKYYCWSSLNNMAILVINFICFVILLATTSKFFNINYFSIVTPLISKKNVK